MMILVVLIQTALFAQSKQTTEKPLKLGSVAVGTLSDDVLLRGATDQEVKKISVVALLINKANLASPVFTGTPTLPTGTIATTQTAGNNTTEIATTAFVTTANNIKANLASPNFTGTPTLPTGTIATTQTARNNTTAIATTAFVAGEIGAGNTDLVTKSTVQTITANKTFSGSTAFNGTAIFGQLIRFSNQTLLASNTVYTSGAIGTVDGHFSFASDNKFPASFSTELVTISIKPILKVPNKSGILATTDDFLNYAPLASPTFTGTPTLPTGTIATTQAAGNNTTAIATTAFVTTAGNLKANLVSPIFTGTPTLPTGTIASTQTAGNNTTAIATTAFVTTAASNFVGLTGNQSITGLKTFAGITYFSSYIGLLNTDSLNSSTTYGSGTIGTIAGNFAIASANKVAGSIATDNVTAFTNPVLQFPNASGTIALTSNLTAYAPLASPTFTGNTKAVAFSLSALNTAPATATATGTLGEIRFTPTGIFICTATNTWIKCVGATF